MSVAALGGTKDPAVKGQYGWSPAYQETLELRLKHDSLEIRIAELEGQLAWHDGLHESVNLSRAVELLKNAREIIDAEFYGIEEVVEIDKFLKEINRDESEDRKPEKD